MLKYPIPNLWVRSVTSAGASLSSGYLQIPLPPRMKYHPELINTAYHIVDFEIYYDQLIKQVEVPR